ncbi:phosphatase PAP2 family protein [Notoacmeibacter ruber]|uniref:Phosphatase PAP2 family protein n=1 Tax=Notoacmeibacter ruber TaxID=2670375 RepID=A0A3L7JA55_9HYPH|nr:phosphatase PAP2 family protein [Notoacmeibacter ruber]RLQ87235.1 phosphatase PAP2 family protein [Notoacmeibacter ruber]
MNSQLKDMALKLVREVRKSPASLAPFVVAAIASAGLFAFLSIADEVDEGETERLDRAVLMFFRVPGNPDETIGPAWVREAAIEYTALGGIPVVCLLVLTVLGFLAVERRWGAALFVSIGILGGMALSSTLKIFYSRPRPDLVAQLDVIHTKSFPSGHATITTCVVLTLAVMLIRLTESRPGRAYIFAMAVLYALLIGATRVYLGVHWPSDVLAGWAIGTFWACLCWVLMTMLQRWQEKGSLFASPRD